MAVKRIFRRKFADFIRGAIHPERHSASMIWMVLLFLIIIVVAIVPDFIHPRNITNVLIQMVPLGLVSIGQTFVILGGGIDLSIGPQVSLITVLASNLMQDSVLIILSTVLLCLLCGFVFGFLNGVLAHYINIPPLVVTLCTGFIFQGIAFALHKTTGGHIPDVVHEVLTASWWILSVPLLIFIVFISIGLWVLNYTRYGRYAYALGGNEEVLGNAGVNIGRIKIATYTIAGFLASVAGIYLAARLKSGGAHYGTAFTLNSITAVVVGGTTLGGGQGGLSGTIAGGIIVSMLNNVLNNVSFKYGFQSSYYKNILTGIILIIAMFFYRKKR
jgi:ribose/xylose/arabinose/galactoside ABC-type transport system permease subunit